MSKINISSVDLEGRNGTWSFDGNKLTVTVQHTSQLELVDYNYLYSFCSTRIEVIYTVEN